MSEQEQKRWAEGKNFDASLIFSHNFVDYAAFEEPIKHSVSTSRLYFDNENKFRLDIPMTLHKASFSDNLFNPLNQDENEVYFLSTSEKDFKPTSSKRD